VSAGRITTSGSTSITNIYVNNEHLDRAFLENRGTEFYVYHQCWLYKFSSEGQYSLDVGDEMNPYSPAVLDLCYSPFAKKNHPSGNCSTPSNNELGQDIEQWINAQALLTLGAVNAFVANPDSLFSHFNNVFFLDFNPSCPEFTRRKYFPWDQDSVVKPNFNIYGEPATAMHDIILGHPTYRAQYNKIFRDLFSDGGPLSEANIHAFIDSVEPVLTDALAADPYNQFDSPGVAGVAERFDQLRSYFPNRIVNVLAQVDADDPGSGEPQPTGVTLLEDSFEDSPWDGNWDNTNWIVETDSSNARSGSHAAYANGTNDGYFTCDALDTSDALSVTVEFWVRKKKTDVGNDILLEYFNGSGYVLIADLDTLGPDRKWLNYKHTIEDPTFFLPDFRIRFDGTPGSDEHVWIDDVLITKTIFVEDSDGDGLVDDADNCPYDVNPDQADGDGDGDGDVCDNCPNTSNGNQADDDYDGMGNVCDNCPQTYTTDGDQSDSDGDSRGDACDNCPERFTPDGDQSDSDGDSRGDACDNCPETFTPDGDQADDDEDGIGNACEYD